MPVFLSCGLAGTLRQREVAHTRGSSLCGDRNVFSACDCLCIILKQDPGKTVQGPTATGQLVHSHCRHHAYSAEKKEKKNKHLVMQHPTRVSYMLMEERGGIRRICTYLVGW